MSIQMDFGPFFRGPKIMFPVTFPDILTVVQILKDVDKELILKKKDLNESP